MICVRWVTLIVFSCAAAPCIANVGEPLAAAKSRAAAYERKYGGVQPMFQTDAKGVVVQECWAAPPEMWSQGAAMALAKDLAPKAVRSSQPKARPRDGGEQSYVWPDGTELIFRVFQERVLQVEVRLKSYKGNRC